MENKVFDFDNVVLCFKDGTEMTLKKEIVESMVIKDIKESIYFHLDDSKIVDKRKNRVTRYTDSFQIIFYSDDIDVILKMDRKNLEFIIIVDSLGCKDIIELPWKSLDSRDVNDCITMMRKKETIFLFVNYRNSDYTLRDRIKNKKLKEIENEFS